MRSQRIHKILNTNATLTAVSMINQKSVQMVVTKKRRQVRRGAGEGGRRERGQLNTGI